MVRKFFAVVILLFFVLVSPLLLVIQSLFSSFANEQFFVNKIIPGSYDYEIELFADMLSQNSNADKLLFQRRLTQLLPRETYIELSSTFVKAVFASLQEWRIASKVGPAAFEIDYKNIRKGFANTIIDRVQYLEECLPDEPTNSFRLCKPAVLAEGTDIGKLSADALEKNLPHNTVVFNKENTRAQEVFGIILLVKDYLPLALMCWAFLFAILMTVLLVPKWHSILKWIGSAFAIVGVFTGLFILIVSKFSDKYVSSTEESIDTETAINMYRFLLNQPMSALTLWVGFILVAAVLLFGLGVILKSVKHKKA